MKFSWLILLLLIVSCGEKSNNQQNKEVEWSKKKSSDFAKEMAIDEDLDIRLFLEQHKDWKMIKTGTGLQYYVYENGSGAVPQIGDEAFVRFEIKLLDGTLCYKTEDDDVENFAVDKSDIETGVQEVIKKMKVGDKAKVIIPSHLAHGLVGDMDKIPPLSTLVVDLHLIKIR